MKSRLIGAVLIDHGLVTPEQLEAALALQEKTGERLGEIVVAEFGVSRLELASVLAEQWAEHDSARVEQPSVQAPELKVAEPLTPDEAHIRRPIGEIFIEQGFISAEQLEAAIAVQKESGKRIGEVLVEQGVLSRLDLASALAEQWSSLQKLRPPAPVADPEPWQNGSPARETKAQEAAVLDNSVLTDLEERLRLIERATASSPSQDDLDRAQLALRSELGALEARFDAVAETAAVAGIADSLGDLTARLDALESASASADVAALRQELGELRAQSSTSDALADVAAAVEHLEARPERSVEVERLAAEIGALTVRLDELTGLDELRERIDAAVGQAQSAETGVLGLAERFDALVALESRLDEISALIPAEGVPGDSVEQAIAGAVAGLRSEIAAAALGQGDDTEPDTGAALTAIADRVNQLAARLDDLASAPASETDGLGARIASLEETAREGAGALDRLAMEVEALGSRTQEQLSELGVRSADSAALEDLRSRLNDLATAVERTPGAAPLDNLDARVTALAARHDSIGSLEARIDELEARIAEVAPVTELREEINQVRESTAAERASLADALIARVEEIAASGPREEELTELRARLDQIATQPDHDGELQRRVESLAARIASLDGVEASIADMRESIAGLDAGRAAEAHATEARLAGVEAAVESFAGLESGIRAGIDRAVAKGTDPLVERLDLAEARLGALTDLEQRLLVLASELERRPDGETVVGELAEVRSRIDELASSSHGDFALRERVDSIALRLDSVESLESRIVEARERIAAIESVRMADALANGTRLAGIEASAASYHEMLVELDGRLSGLAVDLELRLNDDALTGGVAELRARIEQLAAQAAGEEIGPRVSELADRAEAIAGEARFSLNRSADELNGRIDELARAFTGRTEELSERLGGLVARDELDAAAARHVEWFQAELEALRDSGAQRAASLEDRIANVDRAREADHHASRTAVSESLDAFRSEFHVQHDELASHLQAQLAEQRAELELARAEHDAERASTARLESLLENGLAALSSRLDSVAWSLQADSADVRAIVEGVSGQLGEVQRQRLEDVAAAGLAGAELAAQLDDLALRTAESTVEVECRLRDEILALAARVEGRDAAETEAREELRGELERLASSMGWRLERIEESLASDDSAALRENVANIERRLEGQSALGEEQARATERALRKGLAALGERLVESESAYVQAGNTLRRSIERLGAAVVEADARMADQIPVSPLEGCVAFAPTADGYRLVEMPGVAPEVGAVVELEACDGPLVVTRYGRSPLPFDGRPCAYLDRA